MPTLESIQETNDLTLIASVTVPHSSEEPRGHDWPEPMSALLADKIPGDINSASPLLIMAAANERLAKQREELTRERQLAAGEPPMHPAARDQLKQLMFRLDQVHWQRIAEMRVKKYYPLDQPVPPQLPEVLMGQVRWYASMLFNTEADQYDQFRSDMRYGSWLAGLAHRVRARVMQALDRLEEGDKDSLILKYHGPHKVDVENDLRTLLDEIRGQYESGIAPSQRSTAAPPPPPPKVQHQMAGEESKPAAAASSTAVERQALWAAYRREFPSVSIIQVCWAAYQHRREWDRWFKGEKRDGSKPDRMFRSVLSSHRDATTIRQDERPKDWK